MRPDDDTLTTAGCEMQATATGTAATGRLLLIGCGALAHEILTIIRRNGWRHIDLTCLPAILHNTPDRIPDAICRLIEEKRATYDRIFVLYADCGTGGRLRNLCAEMGVPMLEGPHCYAFYEGTRTFAAHGDEEITAFYLTDFLVRQFDAFVWEPLGLDRHPELRNTYFGNYEKLVYLAQTDDPALDAKARECAARLGLRYKRRFTGYGDLQRSLALFATG